MGDAVAFPFAARTANLQIVTGRGELIGWIIWESAGSPAAAQVRFHNGTTTGEPLLGGAKLAASETSEGPNYDEGIRFTVGLFMEIVAGNVEGVVLIR
jgi:hypothetical protein